MVGIIIIGLLMLLINMLFTMVCCMGQSNKADSSICSEEIQQLKDKMDKVDKDVTRLRNDLSKHKENVNEFLGGITSKFSDLGLEIGGN